MVQFRRTAATTIRQKGGINQADPAAGGNPTGQVTSWIRLLQGRRSRLPVRLIPSPAASMKGKPAPVGASEKPPDQPGNQQDLEPGEARKAAQKLRRNEEQRHERYQDQGFGSVVHGRKRIDVFRLTDWLDEGYVRQWESGKAAPYLARCTTSCLPRPCPAPARSRSAIVLRIC